MHPLNMAQRVHLGVGYRERKGGRGREGEEGREEERGGGREGGKEREREMWGQIKMSGREAGKITFIDH